MVLDERTPLVLDILWFLAHSPEPVTLSEIVSGIGHSRTTVDRTLARLCEAGWVCQAGRPKRFTASLRVALMGAAVLRLNRVRELALRYARELAQTVQSSVVLAFYDDGDVIFTDAIDLRGEHFVHDITGVRHPAARAASGKILLAYQPDEEIERVARCSFPSVAWLGYADPEAIIADVRACREQGYALNVPPAQQTGGLAVPVLDRTGRAAVAIGFPLLMPLEEATVNRLLPAARMIALRASTELQNRPSREHLIS
jgi:DNA-binding IclR family transcriptional regulator